MFSQRQSGLGKDFKNLRCGQILENLGCQDKQFGICQVGNGQSQNICVYWDDTDKKQHKET